MNVTAIKQTQEYKDREYIESLKVNHLYKIPMRLILPDPNQPRKYFDPKDVQKKATSMKAKRDVEEALRVVKSGTHVTIVSGETRWRGGLEINLTSISCIVQEFETHADQFISAMKSNINQTRMLPLEEARGFANAMKEKGLNQSQLADELGGDITQKNISDALKLLNLNEKLTKKMETGELNVGIARIASDYPEEEQDEIYDMWVNLRKKVAQKNNRKFESIKIAPNTFRRVVDREMEKRKVKRIPGKRGRKTLSSKDKMMRAIIRHCNGLEEELKLLAKETPESLHIQKTTFTELMTAMEEALKSLKEQTERIQEMDGWKPEDED